VAKQAVVEAPALPRLKEAYRRELVPRLMDELGLKNVMQVPRPGKVLVSMGVGEAAREPKALDSAVEDLTIITGQRPLITKAKRSVAGFKVRQGMSIGAKVTVRGDRMWEFMDRLLSTALPRIRDFRGLNPKGFDGRGNYNFGVTEQLIFPEIDYDKVQKIRGMNITFVTTAPNDEQAFALLRALGFPFAQEGR